MSVPGTEAASHQIIDRTALTRFRKRWLTEPEHGADFLLKWAQDDLAERLAPVSRVFETAIELGSLSPGFAGQMAQHPNVGTWIRLCPAASHVGTQTATNPVVIGDDEIPPLAEGRWALITSILALQWVNDLPGTLVQIRRALRPDGLFLANMIGGQTLMELRDCLMQAELEIKGGASPRILPFTNVQQAGSLMQRAGFALPVIDQDTVTVRYDHALALLRDLRIMGAANCLTERSRRPLSRAVLLRMAEIYAQTYADDDGRIRARFDIISLSGWAPHESQQQPLKPGTAKMSLADALKKKR